MEDNTLTRGAANQAAAREGQLGYRLEAALVESPGSVPDSGPSLNNERVSFKKYIWLNFKGFKEDVNRKK